jgi:hypothetical protein
MLMIEREYAHWGHVFVQPIQGWLLHGSSPWVSPTAIHVAPFQGTGEHVTSFRWISPTAVHVVPFRGIGEHVAQRFLKCHGSGGGTEWVLSFTAREHSGVLLRFQRSFRRPAHRVVKNLMAHSDRCGILTVSGGHGMTAYLEYEIDGYW